MARALLIIDFQNDFTAGGALAVPDGDAIAGRVNELLTRGGFDLVVATRDWHPADHGSFKEQGGPWPPHCVQGTPGAELHPSVPREAVDVVVDAGYEPGLEGYSGFEETNLAALLSERRDRRGDRCRARDRLLREAHRGGRAGEGLPRSTIDRGGIRGIDVEPGDSERALAELQAAGATISLTVWDRLLGGMAAVARDGRPRLPGRARDRARRCHARQSCRRLPSARS